MYSLGYDIGSSSIKASLLEIETGKCIGSAFYPKKEMTIDAPKVGWAEQHPEDWWHHLKLATKELIETTKIKADDIKSIGISYQMHGLVLINKDQKIIRPSIIWCDSRAVEIGDKAFEEIGNEKCLQHLLNSPGNFTASKLKWVKENEPENYSKIYKIMLPGDFIAMKLTGNINTTHTGLSEGILWDFVSNSPSTLLLEHYGISKELLPELIPVFSNQGNLTSEAANELGLSITTIVSYRSGDQPNNALSLNVLNPGEVAATAGTSGVVYGISDKIKYDLQSRVNTFVHVNHTNDLTRFGIMLCINGTGILNSWIKNNLFRKENVSYSEINSLAKTAPIGSDGLSILPFGNGAERMLENKNMGSHFSNLNFNTHSQAHIARAAQEGIAFAFHYGMELMKQTGVGLKTIRAGETNMFLSDLFSSAIATINNATVELYNTDGAQGAARGAAYGAGAYKNLKEVFTGLKIVRTIEPNPKEKDAYMEVYSKWLIELNKHIK